MLELFQGKRKIYVNPQYIASMLELNKGTEITLNSGIKITVDENVMEIAYEIKERQPTLDINSLFGNK